MDEWLVRTSDNFIAGPFSREQIVEMIRSEKLGLQDEICRANHYWIYLHEHSEVEKYLGVRATHSRAIATEDEITETQTDSIAKELLHQVPVNVGEGSVVITRRPGIGGLQSAGARPWVGKPQPVVSVSPQVERVSFWRIFVFLLLVAAAAVLVTVLTVLNPGSQ